MNKIYVYKTQNGQIKMSSAPPRDAKIFARVADEKSAISTAMLLNKYDFNSNKDKDKRG